MQTYKLMCKQCNSTFIGTGSKQNYCEKCKFIEKNCLQCNSIFLASNGANVEKRQFCCRHCAMKHVHNRADIKEATSNWMKKFCNCPETKRFYSEIAKERWRDDEFRLKMSIKQKEIQNRSDVKDIKSKFHKEYQNRDDVKERNRQRAVEYMNRPDVKERNKQHGLLQWQNPDFAEKYMNGCYQYKEYTLPRPPSVFSEK